MKKQLHFRRVKHYRREQTPLAVLKFQLHYFLTAFFDLVYSKNPGFFFYTATQASMDRLSALRRRHIYIKSGQQKIKVCLNRL